MPPSGSAPNEVLLSGTRVPKALIVHVSVNLIEQTLEIAWDTR